MKPPSWRRAYLGGKGRGARYLYEELDAGTDPLGPENRRAFLNKAKAAYNTDGLQANPRVRISKGSKEGGSVFLTKRSWVVGDGSKGNFAQAGLLQGLIG